MSYASFRCGAVVRAALVGGALASVGCSVVPVMVSSSMCERYRSQSDAFGYCLTLNIRSVRAPYAAIKECGAAGIWEEVCLGEWLEGMSQVASASTAGLLHFCPTDDCKLQVLDSRPEADLVLQLEACKEAGKFVQDCRGHAYQRWALARPSELEVRRVSQLFVADSDQRAAWVGMALACGAPGSCEGLNSDQEVCRAVLARPSGECRVQQAQPTQGLE